MMSSSPYVLPKAGSTTNEGKCEIAEFCVPNNKLLEMLTMHAIL